MALLDGRVVLVNSGGGELQREMACALAEHGAVVAVCGPLLRRRSKGSGMPVGSESDAGEKTACRGVDPKFAAGDTGTWEGARAAVEEVASRYGKVDVLVNCPGPVQSGSFATLEPRQWTNILRVVLKSAFCCTRAVVPHMQRQGWGRLLHVLPSQVLFGSGRQAGANAACMAVVGLSRNAGIELEGFGITSNCIAVHGVSRRGAARQGSAGEDRTAESGPAAAEVGRTVGALATFLASERAGAISGQIFGVYGKEILLFSQSRIARSVHRAGGWDAESLREVVEPAMAAHFTPLREPAGGIAWAPLT